jgi:hypothetical protein
LAYKLQIHPMSLQTCEYEAVTTNARTHALEHVGSLIHRIADHDQNRLAHCSASQVCVARSIGIRMHASDQQGRRAVMTNLCRARTLSVRHCNLVAQMLHGRATPPSTLCTIPSNGALCRMVRATAAMRCLAKSAWRCESHRCWHVMRAGLQSTC